MPEPSSENLSAPRAFVLAVLLALACLATPARADDTAAPLPSGIVGALPPEIDPAAIEAFERLMVDTNSRMALLQYKGSTIYENYWKEGRPDAPVEVWSLSKSVASTAIGFLVDEGKIKGIDESMAEYIPSWKGTPKEAIKISDVLDQVTGLKDPVSMGTPADLLQKCIDAEQVHPPGEEHRYNNAACNLLSAVISAAAGEDPESYMKRKMFEPIGMTNTSWRRDDGGFVITYAGVQSTARDIASFGRLFLQKGVWDGERVLSEEWIAGATRPRTTLEIQGIGPVSEYGLLWWVNFGKDRLPSNYSALGLWGNHLTVIPELEIVGVRLVGNRPDGGKLMTMVPQWIESVAAVVRR